MKPIKYYTFVALMIFCPFSPIFSQITTNELPPSFLNIDILKSDSSIEMLTIEAPDMQKINAEDSISDKTPDKLIRIAVPISVRINSDSIGTWKNLPNGDSLWQLTIYVKKAKSLDSTFDKFCLTERGKFFLFGTNNKQTIGAISSQYLRGNYGVQNEMYINRLL